MAHDNKLFPPVEDFEAKFKNAFNREMTPEERKFFFLAGLILDSEEESKEKRGDAVPKPAA